MAVGLIASYRPPASLGFLSLPSKFSYCLPITVASPLYALPLRTLRTIVLAIQAIQSKLRAPNPAYPRRIYPTPSVSLKILQSSSTTMNPEDDHDRSSSTPNGTSKQGLARTRTNLVLPIKKKRAITLPRSKSDAQPFAKASIA